MCAIFGYIARGKSTVSVQTLANIIRGNIGRGPHAFGFSWVDDSNRLRSFKQRGRLTDRLGVLAMTRGAKFLIGHLRWATHGSPNENINNHPHPCDGGWLVHNGVIRNYDELLKSESLWPTSDCDSEILGLLAEKSDGKSPMRRCAEAIEATEGNLALMGLWSRPNQLIVARRGNPLHLSETPEGIYFATMENGLPRAGKKLASGLLRDNTIRVYSRENGSIRCKSIKLHAGAGERSVAGGESCSLFDASTYRGG